MGVFQMDIFANGDDGEAAIMCLLGRLRAARGRQGRITRACCPSPGSAGASSMPAQQVRGVLRALAARAVEVVLAAGGASRVGVI